MWRLLQGIPRVIRQQLNGSFRSAPQSACHEEEPRRSSVTENGVHHPGTSVPLKLEQCKDYKPSVHQPTNDWQDRKRQFSQGSWFFCQPHVTALEAVSLGTAIVLGIQLSHFYNTHEQAEQEHRRRQLSLAHFLCRQAFRSISIARPVNDDHSSSRGVTYVDTGQTTVESDSSKDADVPQSDGTDVLHLTYPHNLVYSQTTVKQTTTKPEPPAELQQDGRVEDATAEFERLISSYTGLAQHRVGLHHMRQGRISEALAYWSQAGLAGNPKANYNIGLCYELGKGTEKNLEKAVEHYSLAAAEGHSYALYNLGVLHLLGHGTEKDPQTAMFLLEQAAEQGLKQAQTQLGVLYTEEERKDMKKAASLFNMAAQQKDRRGLYYLGICFENGWGVEQNQCKAAELYSQASRLGHRDSTHNLAVFFEQGRGGIPEDWDTAAHLYSQAAKAGCVQAKKSLDNLEVKRQQRYSSIQEENGKQSSIKSKGTTLSAPVLTKYVQEHLVDFGVPSNWDLEDSPVSRTNPKSSDLKFDLDEELIESKHQNSDTDGDLKSAVKFYLGGGLLARDSDQGDESEYSGANPQEANHLILSGTWGDLSHLSPGQRSCSLTQLSRQPSFKELNYMTCT